MPEHRRFNRDGTLDYIVWKEDDFATCLVEKRKSIGVYKIFGDVKWDKNGEPTFTIDDRPFWVWRPIHA